MCIWDQANWQIHEINYLGYVETSKNVGFDLFILLVFFKMELLSDCVYGRIPITSSAYVALQRPNGLV